MQEIQIQYKLFVRSLDRKLDQLGKYLWLPHIDDRKIQITAQLCQCCHHLISTQRQQSDLLEF